MDTNKESILSTLPWKVFGEGLEIASAAARYELRGNAVKDKLAELMK